MRTPAGAADFAPWIDRVMTADDLPRVHALEVRCHSHPWTAGNLRDALQAGDEAWLRETAPQAGGAPRLLGYTIVKPGVQEAHLLNLTVDPAARRAGHGRALLQAMQERALKRGDAAAWLEVREGNAAALALYRQAGWQQVAVRPAYYPAPGGREAAVVMRFDLAPAGPVAGHAPHAGSIASSGATAG